MLETITDLKGQVQQLEQRIDAQRQQAIPPVQQEQPKDTKTEIQMAVMETIRQLQLNGVFTKPTNRTCSFRKLGSR